MTINQPIRTPMPRSLRFAIGGLVFQAIGNSLIGLLLLSLSDDDLGDGAGLLKFIGGVSLLLGIVLAACAFLVIRRLNWVRTVVTVIEALSILSGVLALFSGSVPGVVGIFIAVAIIRAVNSAEGRAWFTA